LNARDHRQASADTWLDQVVSQAGTLSILLQPFFVGVDEAYEISKLVNDPRNDSPACIEPFAMPLAQSSLI
jgi:putative SOS response-associated peptidase YedK